MHDGPACCLVEGQVSGEQTDHRQHLLREQNVSVISTVHFHARFDENEFGATQPGALSTITDLLR